MILGAMQPYFFPYLGYFDLINRADTWLVFDVVKYAPRSWMNRNRIQHPQSGWQFFGVPVRRRDSDGRIESIRIQDPEGARQRLLGQIDHYRLSRAPFFGTVRDIVDDCFKGLQGDKLRDLNVRSLALVCDYLGIRFKPINVSDMQTPLPPVEHAGGWALELSTIFGASEYVNPPNGRSLFVPEDFAARGIKLTFTEPADFRYDCGRYEFVERLSIVDVMMWSPPSTIKAYLDTLKHG